MVITRTPFRVSFAGGGSDLPAYYAAHGGGLVVSAAIRKYMYIVIHPYFHDRIRIKYSRTEDVEQVDEIRHPIVRACLQRFPLQHGLEITSFADVPAGTGLGSSSAFTVGLLHALYRFHQRRVSPLELAREACRIEIELLGEPIGKQDQYAVAMGGLNRIRFDADDGVEVTPIDLDAEVLTRLEENLGLYYIGGQHSAAAILTAQGQAMSQADKAAAVGRMVEVAAALDKALRAGRWAGLGDALRQGWEIKRTLADGVSNTEIDGLLARADALGASGGKLLGAGGAGFLLLFAPDKGRLVAAFGAKNHLPFEIDWRGSTVITQD